MESVIAHFGQANPLILVHNGSLKEAEGVLRERFLQIQHVVVEENRGYSGGANIGLREAFRRASPTPR